MNYMDDPRTVSLNGKHYLFFEDDGGIAFREHGTGNLVRYIERDDIIEYEIAECLRSFSNAARAPGSEASQATVAENWKIAAELVTAFQRLDDMAWEENTTLAGTKTLHAAVIKAMEALKRQPPSSSADEVTALKAQVEAARAIIDLGVEIMESHQVGQWSGVREWLERDTLSYVQQEHES